MKDLPSHASPNFSDEAREDALFHYTTATGLIGILTAGRIWSTAYYCANDESELAAGKGVLTQLFKKQTYEMIDVAHPHVEKFAQSGIDILREYAENFEQHIADQALDFFCAYITCFCKPVGEEDFRHGLLSQWRGYGTDGGYAIQFSRKKLQAAVEQSNEVALTKYELQDVHYTPDNPLKAEVLKHNDAFTSAYCNFLDDLANIFVNKTVRSPLAGLPGGPLESFLEYLIHTKSQHFGEERECRLSLLEARTADLGHLPVEYFNRGGTIVPYVKTPLPGFSVLSCIEWIVVGPGPRMTTRFNSVVQMVRRLGQNIAVRPSHIPFSRF